MAELVRTELRALGAEPHEDDAAPAPAGCGNIVARFAPTAEGTPILFGSTWTPCRRPPIEPVASTGTSPTSTTRSWAATTSPPSRWCSRR